MSRSSSTRSSSLESEWPLKRTARSCRAAATPRRGLPKAMRSRSSSRSAEASAMNAPTLLADQIADPLLIAGRAYRSRLLIGTGKYRDFDETRRAVEASGAEIVTVAIRRTNIGQNAAEPSLLDALPPSRFTILPNTAGCYNAEDAVRTLRLARELLDGHDLVKLEVLGDPNTLYPNIVETLKAAETLVRDGFKVMVYTSDDPNTAVAKAQNPVLMAQAMKKAVEAGREAFLAGRMPKKLYSASPSSPASGLIPPKAA